MSKAKKRASPKPLHVRVSFVGAAAAAIRRLHRRGLHGPTIQLVVEGLVLDSVRRDLRAMLKNKVACVRCADDGNPCMMCGACDEPRVPCDPDTGDPIEDDARPDEHARHDQAGHTPSKGKRT
jgi:hypothetical protein